MSQPDDAGRLPVFASHGICDTGSDLGAGIFGGGPLCLLLGRCGGHTAGLASVENDTDFAFVAIVAKGRVDQDNHDDQEEHSSENDGFLHVSITRDQGPAGVSGEEVAHTAEFFVPLFH